MKWKMKGWCSMSSFAFSLYSVLPYTSVSHRQARLGASTQIQEITWPKCDFLFFFLVTITEYFSLESIKRVEYSIAELFFRLACPSLFPKSQQVLSLRFGKWVNVCILSIRARQCFTRNGKHGSKVNPIFSLKAHWATNQIKVFFSAVNFLPGCQTMKAPAI